MSRSFKSPALATAQRRKDEEKAAYQSIIPLIPSEYFLNEIENSGNYSTATKALKAAELFLRAQAQAQAQAQNQEEDEIDYPSDELITMSRTRAGTRALTSQKDHGQGNGGLKRRSTEEAVNEEEHFCMCGDRKPDYALREGGRHHDITSGFSATNDVSSFSMANFPELQQLRQCSRRIVHIAEGKAAEIGEEDMRPELKRALEWGSDLLIDLIKVIDQQGWSREKKAKWEKARDEWAKKVRID